MLKRLFVSLVLVLAFAVGASAQEPQTFFVWSHETADLSASAVTHFMVQFDDEEPINVGLPQTTRTPPTPAEDTQFRYLVPALTPGEHTVTVQACNASGCGDFAEPLTFTLVVKPKTPRNLRMEIVPPDGGSL